MAIPKDKRCEPCVLNTKRICTGFMSPEGTGSRRLLLWAEALGEHEERDGLPLRPHAQAGAVVARAIRQLSLTRDELLMTNMVWGRPQKNFLEGAWYEQEAIDSCHKYNRELLDRARPRAILAMGNIPLKHLTGWAGKSKSVMSVRGYVLPSLREYYLDGKPIPVIPTVHPSFIARGGDHMFGAFLYDFQKALEVASGRLTEENGDFILNPEPEGYNRRLEYTTRPSLWAAQEFLAQCRWIDAHPEDYPSTILSGDIETDFTWRKKMEDESELDGKDTSQITQIQFSIAPGTGIAFPWQGEFKEIAKELLRLRNLPKIGHNWYRFDYRKLRAEGVEVAGTQWDSMTMFRHAQPDLPANLQFASSFFGFPHPWKHMIGEHFEYYGICDVDAVQRIWTECPVEMRRRGIWDGFVEYTKGLQPILQQMMDNGIGVSVERREALRGEIHVEKGKAEAEIGNLVPGQLRPVHPKEGYKVWPKEIREYKCQIQSILEATAHNPWVYANWGPLTNEIREKYGIEFRSFEIGGKIEIRPAKIEPFLPNSTAHVKNLIKHYGAAIPKNMDGADTTGKDELEKLIVRLRNNKVKYKMEPYLKLATALTAILEYRRLNKIESTYIDGWVVGEDGRVHPTFGFGTATGQLNSTDPNAQNGPKHGSLAKRWRRTIVAKPGHTLAEFDYKSFHALTLGFEARSANYMRLARLDCHSYLAWRMAKLPGWDNLLALDDESLKDRLNWFKSDPDRKYIRDKKAKPTILGYGFGLGAEKMFHMNSEAFSSAKECEYAISALDEAFPELPAYRRNIRDQAMREGYLVSRYGFIRYFFGVAKWSAKAQAWVMGGEDAEAALAFLPANDAFGKIREAMLDLHEPTQYREGGVLFRPSYWLVNTIHDSLIFEIPDEDLEWALLYIYRTMVQPARKLVDPVLAPNGLVCDVEVATGKNWAPWHAEGNPDGMKEVHIR